jgi:hypothetical protein
VEAKTGVAVRFRQLQAPRRSSIVDSYPNDVLEFPLTVGALPAIVQAAALHFQFQQSARGRGDHHGGAFSVLARPRP